MGKEDLRYKAGTSIHQFNKAWRLLLHKGYLTSTPVYGQNGIAYYEHVIHDIAVSAENKLVAKIESEAVIETKKRLTKTQMEETKRNIIFDIKKNISYNEIAEECKGNNNFFIVNEYNLRDVDEYITLMADYIASEQPHQFINTRDINHNTAKETMYRVNRAILCYTIQRCNKKIFTEDCHLSKKYKLASLYNNATRYLNSDERNDNRLDDFIKELA